MKTPLPAPRPASSRRDVLKASVPLSRTEALADDPGRRAVYWAAGTTYCRPPDEEIVIRGLYLIGYTDGSGELVFKNTSDTPRHLLSRTHVSAPMSGCPEISITLAPETFIQLRAGLFGRCRRGSISARQRPA